MSDAGRDSIPSFSLNFPLAYGEPIASADFRCEPHDFVVDEVLGFEPSGYGEHIYLQVRKTGENTAWVAEQIAQFAKVAKGDVGYAGRKDRHAVTTQWFSVYFPKPEVAEPDWSQLNSDTLNIIRHTRHQQKLRKGDHQGNRFQITLRHLHTSDKNRFDKKINDVLDQGVPNYFGEQRFGHNGNNLLEAHELLVEGKRYKNKQKRGLILSAARSYLFNKVLANRVAADNWRDLLPGEPAAIPTGPLWGRGRPLAQDQLLLLEEASLGPWHAWCESLEYVGLQQERRSLILRPENASFDWVGEVDLQLNFSLGGGMFATAVLREIALLRNQHAAPAEGEPD